MLSFSLGANMSPASQLAELVRTAREAKGLSRKQLADLAGLDPSYLSRIESGERLPSRDLVLALADALGVSDQQMQTWLVAAGYAPMPILGALRAIRTRGAVPPDASLDQAFSGWQWRLVAQTVEQRGLNALSLERFVAAFAQASRPVQHQTAECLSRAVERVTRILESPIRAAAIPIAGRNERLLAPHVLQRLLLHVIAEAAEIGVSDIVLVLAPGYREAIFEPLSLAASVAIIPSVRLHCVEQPTPAGLGDAILCAADRIGEQPFAVLLADDWVKQRGARPPLADLSRMWSIFRQDSQAHVVALDSMSKTEMLNSGVAQLAEVPSAGKAAPIVRLLEKPRPDHEIFRDSRVLGVVGRYLLRPSVFGALRRIKQQRPTRVELTDALEELRQQGEPLLGYVVEGQRRDVGGIVRDMGELIGSR